MDDTNGQDGGAPAQAPRPVDFAALHDHVVAEIGDVEAALGRTLAEAAALRQRLALLRQAEAPAARLAGRGSTLEPESPPSPVPGWVGAGERPTIARVIESSLVRIGRPSTVAAIFDSATRHGYTTVSRRYIALNNFSRALRAAPGRFKRVARGLWWFADGHVPPDGPRART